MTDPDAPLVLVIDDQPDVAEALAALCRAAGATVVVSASDQRIGALLELHRPAGVVLDILMPNEDGFEALREIAQIDAATRVLLVTGAGENWLRMGESLGRANGLASVQTALKPVQSADVQAFVESLK